MRDRGLRAAWGGRDGLPRCGCTSSSATFDSAGEYTSPVASWPSLLHHRPLSSGQSLLPPSAVLSTRQEKRPSIARLQDMKSNSCQPKGARTPLSPSFLPPWALPGLTRQEPRAHVLCQWLRARREEKPLTGLTQQHPQSDLAPPLHRWRGSGEAEMARPVPGPR